MAMIAPREILRLASAMPHPDAQRTDTHQALLDRCMIVALRVQTGRPIRRVLSGCRVAATSVTAISLGTTLPQPSSGLPGNSASSLNVPCLTLLRTRFTQRARSLGPLVVSYTTVSPLPPAAVPEGTATGGGLLSVALSRGLLRVGVTHRPALWSPDVPRHPSEEA